MTILTVIGAVALILASAAVIAWQAGNILRVAASVVRFNIAGDGPMQRLFPNLAFIALCVLMLKLTWF